MILGNQTENIFRQPVQWKLLGLIQYPQIVKHPMDLTTVQKKFNQKSYKYIENVCDEIQLIWDNCKRFNPPNSWIYETAEKLQRAFKKMAKNYFPDLEIQIPIKTQHQSKKNQISMIDQEYEDITYHDKLRFSQALSFLTSKDLQKIVKQIQKKCPSAYRQGDQLEKGKCQLLIDNMDLNNFNQILSHIKQMSAKAAQLTSNSQINLLQVSEKEPQNKEVISGAPSKKVKK